MKINLNDVTNINSITTINDNFDKIEQEFQNKVLYRDNPTGEPNTVEKDLDMNGFDIINVKDVYSASGKFATINEVTALNSQTLTYKNQAQQYSLDSLQYKNDISDIAIDVQGYQLDTKYTYNLFNKQFLGVKSSDPSTDNQGNTLEAGTMYFRNTAPELMRIYNGSTWQDVGSIITTTTNTIDPTLFATKLESEQGVNDTKVVTPAKVKDAINSQVKGGFTSTGPIVLPENASSALQATPLQQVNALITSAVDVAVADITTSTQSGRLLRVERFKASGTFTKQVGDRLIEAVLIGAGGGGGGANGTGGGGAGSTVLKVFQAADLAASEPVTVGWGGTTGLDGTFSKFSTAQANGGGAGVGSLGGSGGGGGLGDLLINGGGGGAGVPAGKFSDATFRIFGHGGNSSIGGGAAGQAANANSGDNGAPNTGGGGMGSGGGGSGYVELRIYS